MELKVWIGSVQRVICGVGISTTSQEVIVALAQATGKTGRFTLVEKWRDNETTLHPSDCPLKRAQEWGEYASEVQFILRQSGETTNKRLAEAKSPLPQRRKNAIKKSFSFSGGMQSGSLITSHRTVPKEQSITEEPSAPQSKQVHHEITGAEDRLSGAAEKEKLSADEGSTASSTSSHRHHRKSSEQDIDKLAARAHRRRSRTQEIDHDKETSRLKDTVTEQDHILEQQKKRLSAIDEEIASITEQEEQKWTEYYDCQEEINRTLLQVHELEKELDSFDEVLMSEQLNVLLRQQTEIKEEEQIIHEKLLKNDTDLREIGQSIELLDEKLRKIDSNPEPGSLHELESEQQRLEQLLEEKKRFLEEAESGYRSVCEDYEEAEVSLNKRQTMIEELERELREYNLKNFINSGFTERANSAKCEFQKSDEMFLSIMPAGDPEGLYV